MNKSLIRQSLRNGMEMMTFRKPDFTIADGNAPCEEGSLENLVKFIGKRRRRSVIPIDKEISNADPDDIGISSEQKANDNDNDGEEDVAASEVVTNDSPLASVTTGITPEGIQMLETHIAAFRKRTNDALDSDEKDNESHIPPQLLRVVRFFPFKWLPLKRALLRPPSKNEIGKITRLNLAKALHSKKLITLAEIDLLEQSFYNIHEDKDKDKNSHESIADNRIIGTKPHDKKTITRKRPLDHHEIANELKMVFSRLPIDIGNYHAMRHMKTVVNDYCNQLNTSQDDENDVTLPAVDIVAEWALLSFNGVVASNGFDDNQEHGIESQMVILLTSENSENEKFTNAVKSRIKILLEPPAIEELSNFNILCLARFISYLDGTVAEMLFAHAMVKNLHRTRNHGSGFSVLPKLLASFFSIIVKRNPDFSPSLCKSNVKQLLVRTDSIDGEADRVCELSNIMFRLAEDLLNGSQS